MQENVHGIMMKALLCLENTMRSDDPDLLAAFSWLEDQDVEKPTEEGTETEYVVDVNDFEWLLRRDGKIVDRAILTREGHDNMLERNGLSKHAHAMMFKDEA